jgi:uncharacterized protein YyaL (SSP411 family)
MNNAMEKAVQWLVRAQDISSDDGFASHYHLDDGWYSSYPEVTGYIIPTLFDYARKTQRDDLINRGLKAADWLLSIQMDSGAFQGRLIADKTVTPVIFNTGMVIFGLVDAFLESMNYTYKKSAIDAANWLLQSKDSDGVWRKNLTLSGTGETHIYHTRVSWGLLRVFDITQDERYVQAVNKHINWALANQEPNGWFTKSDLKKENYHRPLIHFLIYTIRGVLECGIHQNNSKWIEAATNAAAGFLQSQVRHNMVYARYDNQWTPTVNWKCLTGIAQISIVYMRIFRLTNDIKWIEAADQNLDYLVGLQGNGEGGINGALTGSEPVDEAYMPNCYLSWATKFHLDAMILRDEFT